MDEPKPILLAIAEKCTQDMMEHCDSVQVFLTVFDPETKSTRHVSVGDGNWYAREGQIREWCMQNEERSRIEAHEEEE